MAPELLMKGHASKASDVYAFGILMWELASGGRAFAGTPRALLGHQVSSPACASSCLTCHACVALAAESTNEGLFML